MYSSITSFESTIDSNNFTIHTRNSLISKTNRSALMSYLQGAKIISADEIKDKIDSDFQKVDNFGNTKLMYLCAFNKNSINYKIIKLLNSDIGRQNNKGVTALMYLCSESYFNLTSLNIFTPEMRKYDIYGMTALMYYARTIHPTKKILFQLSQELNMVDNLGQTALMHFCLTNKKDLRSTYVEQISTLFKHEFGKQCNVGRTALMRYILSSEISVNIINMLSLEIGIRDNEGNTALLIYLSNAENPKISIIKLLRNEILIKNDNNILPIHIAEYKWRISNCQKDKEIVDFIEQYMSIERIKNNIPFATIEKNTIIVQKKVHSPIPIEIKSNNSSHKNLFGMRDPHGISNQILNGVTKCHSILHKIK